MRKKYRKNLFFGVKLLIGVGLLAVLLLMDDNWRDVIRLAGDIRPLYLIPFFGVSVALVGVSCLKWRIFLRGRSVDLSIFRLMRLYLIGFFFNNFFPSNFGGDTVRSYILGRQIDSQERALATVFLERFTGFLAMVSLALGSFLLSPTLQQEALVRWSVLFMGALMVGVVVVIWKPRLIKWMLSPVRHIDIVATLEEKASNFHHHVAYFGSEPWVIVRAMLYSYAFYFFGALSVYLAGLLLGIQSSFGQVLVVTPIIMLIAAFPLTPNSLGVWEWAFSVYLTSAGVANEQGLAIALALRAKNIILSLIGGVFFLFEPGTYAQSDETDASSTSEPDVGATGDAVAELQKQEAH